MPMEATKTVKLRIKHAKVLSAMAREVNQVWNFCNEIGLIVGSTGTTAGPGGAPDAQAHWLADWKRRVIFG